MSSNRAKGSDTAPRGGVQWVRHCGIGQWVDEGADQTVHDRSAVVAVHRAFALAQQGPEIGLRAAWCEGVRIIARPSGSAWPPFALQDAGFVRARCVSGLSGMKPLWGSSTQLHAADQGKQHRVAVSAPPAIIRSHSPLLTTPGRLPCTASLADCGRRCVPSGGKGRELGRRPEEREGLSGPGEVPVRRGGPDGRNGGELGAGLSAPRMGHREQGLSTRWKSRRRVPRSQCQDAGKARPSLCVETPQPGAPVSIAPKKEGFRACRAKPAPSATHDVSSRTRW